MAIITMDTDWGARGAQLTGAQVQAFIKEQLRLLQQKDIELKEQLDSSSSSGQQQLKDQIDQVQSQINSLKKQLENAAVAPNWSDANKQSKGYIKNKPEIPTVTSVPSASYKSYVNTDGTTTSFKVGDLVRYKDEQGNYMFYQVVNILSDGQTVWKLSGSAGELTEIAVISISANQKGAVLTGKNVTVAYKEKSVKHVWDGNAFSVEIPKDTAYTVSVDQMPEYKAPDDLSLKSVGGFCREINMEYKAEKVVVKVEKYDGASCSDTIIKIINSSTNTQIASVPGNSAAFTVPFGTPYKIEVNDSGDYVTPDDQVNVAGVDERHFLFLYKKNEVAEAVHFGGRFEASSAPFKRNTMVTFGDSALIAKKDTSEPPYGCFTDSLGNRFKFSNGGYVLCSKSVNPDWEVIVACN